MRVLVIDDDEMIRFAIRMYADTLQTSESLELIMVENGIEGLNTMKELSENGNIPTLVLMDLNMPVLDGWQFLEKLSEVSNAKESDIYVVSSTVDVEEIDKAESNPLVKGFLPKPILFEDFQNLISGYS